MPCYIYIYICVCIYVFIDIHNIFFVFQGGPLPVSWFMAQKGPTISNPGTPGGTRPADAGTPLADGEARGREGGWEGIDGPKYTLPETI